MTFVFCFEIFVCLFVCIILSSLFSTYRPYRHRQKPANGTQCLTLMTDDQGSFTCIITDMVTHGMAFVEPVSSTGGGG